MFDYIIIGKGLIGSAAAKYLSLESKSVVIIGPDEPVHDVNSAQVYASHYDQGRVQRMIGIDPVWTLLNTQSVSAYAQLEKESGIKFHYPVGCLYVYPEGKDDYLEKLPQQAKQFNVPYDHFDNGEAIHKALPDFVFPARSNGMLESGPSGHINPLQLIKAQLTIFEKNGGKIFKDTVTSVSKVDNCYQIQTAAGEKMLANKVLITAGAFSNFLDLTPKKLDLELESETVLLARVDKKEAERLSALPSLLYELDNPTLNGIYSVRPVLYPDGHFYLKMGCNLATDIPFRSLEEIQQWFRNGDSDSNLDVLKNALFTIMPNLNATEFLTKRCVISRTRHRKTYIGEIEKGMYIAAGGNGYCAMCSDALGRISSHLVRKEILPSEYLASSFEPIFV